MERRYYEEPPGRPEPFLVRWYNPKLAARIAAEQGIPIEQVEPDDADDCKDFNDYGPARNFANLHRGRVYKRLSPWYDHQTATWDYHEEPIEV